MIETFKIAPDGKSITCLRCGMTSWSLKDVEHHYCGHCKVFHDDIWPPAREWWIKSLAVKPQPKKDNHVNTINGWVSSHPAKAVLFAALFASVTTGFGIMWCADALTLREIICWLALAAAIVLAILVDIRRAKVAAIALVVALLWPRAASAEELTAEPAAVPVACAVVVIVIGGTAYYFMSKFCEKHFPKTPTNNVHETELAGTATDDYAAGCSFAPCGSCLMAAPNPGASNLLFELTAQVSETDEGPQVAVVSSRCAPQEELVSVLEYHTALAQYGISISAFATEPIMTYGKNGQPSTAADVPISILPPANLTDTPLIILSRDLYGLHPVFLEKSTNLVDWATVSKSFVPAGMKMVFSDISASERAFYRLKIPD